MQTISKALLTPMKVIKIVKKISEFKHQKISYQNVPFKTMF